jgi:O-methyltransferase
MKTINSIWSRLKMFPKVVSIAYRSLRTSTYVRQRKYLKFSPDFDRTIAKRDPTRGLTVTYDEIYTIYSSVLATGQIEGAIAEVGVYKGNTAKVICETKGERPLFLFDTFEGMPETKITDRDDWEPNTHTDNSVASVRAYLADYPNVYFVSGIFPESINNYSAHRLKEQTFSLVNLDVDLYQSTLDALNFFYPRLTIGGRLISHNYNLKDSPGGNTPGVKSAFCEFFEGNTSSIVEIAETQCLIVKAN